ncbi:MAG: RluA family pseudouridine synthase [Elusimicrobiota bacterium]
MNTPELRAPKYPVIIYEDGEILAVSKPAGQAVIPGRGICEEPLSVQASRLAGGKAYVVHRIDREASGLVVFAKTTAAHRRLCMEFEARKVRKTYWTLAWGQVNQDGQIKKPLRLFGSGRMAEAANGKPCLTRYRVLERFPKASWLEVSPLTGRRHQIRAHFFSLGHPLLGDTLYGNPRPIGGWNRLMLHALEIEFTGQKSIKLRAEPGEDFLKILAQLRADCAHG